MNNSKAFEVQNLLNVVHFDIKDSKLSYCVQRNIDLLESIRKSFDKTVTSLKSDRYKELEEILKPLVEKAIDEAKIGTKELSNSAIIAIQNDIIDSFEHKDEWKAESKTYNKLIEELYELDSEFKPFTIKYSYVEPLGLNGDQMRAIYNLLEHDNIKQI